MREKIAKKWMTKNLNKFKKLFKRTKSVVKMQEKVETIIEQSI